MNFALYNNNIGYMRHVHMESEAKQKVPLFAGTKGDVEAFQIVRQTEVTRSVTTHASFTVRSRSLRGAEIQYFQRVSSYIIHFIRET